MTVKWLIAQAARTLRQVLLLIPFLLAIPKLDESAITADGEPSYGSGPRLTPVDLGRTCVPAQAWGGALRFLAWPSVIASSNTLQGGMAALLALESAVT